MQTPLEMRSGEPGFLQVSSHLSFAAGLALSGCLNLPLSAAEKVTLAVFWHLQKPPHADRSSAGKREGRRR